MPGEHPHPAPPTVEQPQRIIEGHTCKGVALPEAVPNINDLVGIREGGRGERGGGRGEGIREEGEERGYGRERRGEKGGGRGEERREEGGGGNQRAEWWHY
jgi:hypothetical protein